MKKLLTTLLCFLMAISCVFGVAACAPADDKGNTGAVTPSGDQPGGTEQPGGDQPGGDQPGGTEQPGGDQPGGTEQPGGDEQDPGGEETPEPTPEPSEGLEFFLVTEDDAESMKEILGYYYTPCYGLIGMGTCTDTDIVIPAEYNGLPVCVVRLDALSESVTSLYFPDSVDLFFCEYAPNFRALTDLRLPHNPDLMIIKLSPSEITPSPFVNSAFYQDPDNWEDGALYMNDWLLATNETLPTDYTVKAGTYGIAGMAFLDAYYGASTSTGGNINQSNSTGSHVERVTLPDSVKAFQAAFMDCQTLKEVVLPDGILTIGSAAFGYCLGLTEISIPESVTRINYYALWGCGNLTAITIPDSVTIIDDFAFDGCEKLTSIVIPDSVTEVGESAFEYCSSLTTVYYTGSEAEWEQIEIGSWNDELLNAEIVFNYKGE